MKTSVFITLPTIPLDMGTGQEKASSFSKFFYFYCSIWMANQQIQSVQATESALTSILIEVYPYQTHMMNSNTVL